jgi:catechol 2,3-dioxygenase-like lactoylglutathione lyase family enzyme
MVEAERIAVERGRALLTLDTGTEDGAGAFYEKLGFVKAGMITDFALKPYGGLQGTVIYWKRLAPRGGSTMSVKEVAAVSVPVSDQQRAKSFYVDVLGLELLRDDSSIPGVRWIQVGPVGGGTTLTLVTWFESMPPGSLRGLVLRMTNLQADYEALVAKGVEFEGPPTQQPWGIETVVHDPDGNAIVLQQA